LYNTQNDQPKEKGIFLLMGVLVKVVPALCRTQNHHTNSPPQSMAPFLVSFGPIFKKSGYRLVWATLKTDASSAILDLKKNCIILQQNYPVILTPIES
jgi:hypothetical protein